MFYIYIYIISVHTHIYLKYVKMYSLWPYKNLYVHKYVEFVYNNIFKIDFVVGEDITGVLGNIEYSS